MAAEDLTGVMRNPTETFRKILASGEGLSLPFAIVLVNGLLSGISSYYQKLHAMEQMKAMMPQLESSAMPLLPLQEPNLASEVLRNLILAPIGWVIVTALILVMSRILGGRAEARGLLAVNGYAQVPLIIGGVLGIAASVATPSLAMLPAFLFGLWSLGVLIIGVREASRFSTLRAVAAVVVPVIALAVLITALLLGALLALIGGGASDQVPVPVR